MYKGYSVRVVAGMRRSKLKIGIPEIYSEISSLMGEAYLAIFLC